MCSVSYYYTVSNEKGRLVTTLCMYLGLMIVGHSSDIWMHCNNSNQPFSNAHVSVMYSSTKIV